MENEHSELIIGYLQGRLQGRSLDDFYAWVNESADNKKLFFETKALYEACAPSRGASEIHDSWLRLLDKRKSRQRKRYSLLTRISTYAAAAMFAAAITSTVFIFSSREYDDRITSYVGGDGLEADVVVLPDGTRVSLGTRTSFSYDSRYGKSERIVQLEGEAYFEVAKDKDKPFIVKTKEQSIEALGTKFNVSAYPTDSLLTTALLEGSVLLTTQNLLHPTVLKPNEQFVYNKRTRSALLQQVDANRFVSWTTGYYYFPEQSLEAILYRLVVELGDLKDMGDTPERGQTLSFLDEIEAKFQTFDGPVYHVLGNHDMDSISKSEFLAHTSNYGSAKGKPYYSFVRNQIKFIVLDGNCNEDGSDYDSGNFDWTKAFIPAGQREWLQQELKKDDLPVVIFIHELLDTFSGIDKELCIGNAEEIVSILEQSGKVVAVIQGHHHAGNYSFRHGIHYFTMKGMIEGSLPENNSFAVIEIDKDLNIYIEGFYNCKNKEMKHNR